MTPVPKKTLLIAGLVVAAVIIGILFLPGFPGFSAPATIEDLEEMQFNPPPDYIQKLSGIIRTNPDPYVRERAVFTVADISLRKNESGMVRDLLKEVALHGSQENIRSAGYANLALLEEIAPGTPRAAMNISVAGTARSGNTITILATITSTQKPSGTRIGINRLQKGLELTSPQVQKVQVSPGEPSTVQFGVRITAPGKYVIPVTLHTSFNQADMETIENRIFLNTATGGKPMVILS